LQAIQESLPKNIYIRRGSSNTLELKESEFLVCVFIEIVYIPIMFCEIINNMILVYEDYTEYPFRNVLKTYDMNIEHDLKNLINDMIIATKI